MIGWKLYLIEILHQTTTLVRPALFQPVLYLIEILHQTTTRHERIGISTRCILSKFYIKPQHYNFEKRINYVVSYRNSTSNHNKPLYSYWVQQVVSYRNSTSNPTQSTVSRNAAGCILSKFYIKPQHYNFEKRINYVVSYRNSTSNHNLAGGVSAVSAVVSYRNSTSNHNIVRHIAVPHRVVSYRNSTSNHNSSVTLWRSWVLYLIEILHQTTTEFAAQPFFAGCILSKFYIKPQHWLGLSIAKNGCILSKFYIKPQQEGNH